MNPVPNSTLQGGFPSCRPVPIRGMNGRFSNFVPRRYCGRHTPGTLSNASRGPVLLLALGMQCYRLMLSQPDVTNE